MRTTEMSSAASPCRAADTKGPITRRRTPANKQTPPRLGEGSTLAAGGGRSNTRRATLNSQHSTLNPEQSVFAIRSRLQENFQRVEAILTDMQNHEDPRIRLEAAAELRQHIAIARKTLESASRAEAVRALEQMVWEALDKSGVEVRRRALDILNARTTNLQRDLHKQLDEEPAAS